MPFDYLGAIFGNMPAEAPNGGGGGQAEVAMGQAGVGMQQQNQAFGGIVINGQDLVMNHHQLVIRQGMNGLPEYQAMPQRPAPRAQYVPAAFEAVQDMSAYWLRDGLDFTEIVVPKRTFMRLRDHLGGMRGYQMDVAAGRVAPAIDVLTINTAMGPVKITCEDDRKMSFNLDKYMETVE